MAQELPYFRFVVQEWQNGKISLESFELQGLFISICGYYWLQDCSIAKELLCKKFRGYEKQIDELIKLDIMKLDKRNFIQISFLNIQFDLLSEKRKRRQEAGSKGGNAKAKLKQNHSYKDNNKDNIRKDNNKFSFKYYLLEICSNEQLVNDWLLVRKNKKATNTKTAFDLFLKEVQISDITAEEILTTCVEKSWSGYKFEWILNERKKVAQKKESEPPKSKIEQNQEMYERLHKKLYGNEQNTDDTTAISN